MTPRKPSTCSLKLLKLFGITQHKWMPRHVCPGRKSGETLERLYKAADTASAGSGLVTKISHVADYKRQQWSEGLSRVENRLKNDLNEVMANSIFFICTEKTFKICLLCTAYAKKTASFYAIVSSYFVI